MRGIKKKVEEELAKKAEEATEGSRYWIHVDDMIFVTSMR